MRKEKTKVKDGAPVPHDDSDRSASIGDFPMPGMPPQSIHFPQHAPSRPHYSDLATIKSGSSGEERGYARVQKPVVPVLYDSGIEKSTFRSLMDKKSEGVRKGLAKTFGKKKKDEDRPPTSTTIRADSYELDGGNYVNSPNYGPNQSYSKPRMVSEPEPGRPGPPQGKLPPIPQAPAMKRWIGGGRAPQAWNKLRKDPELWDPNGDVLVYFARDDQYGPKPPPSFRLASHMLERTGSTYLEMLLNHGSLEGEGNFNMPPSPYSSPGVKSAYPVRQPRYQQTPPISENSSRGYEGQVSYELYFDSPSDKSPNEVTRQHLTTRNVFALIYQVSLAGFNFFQTLTDLQERLEEWMPPNADAAGMIIDYLVGKRFDDFRDNLSMATSVLAWSESRSVRWEEGWTDAFIHCCGMYSRLETCPDFRYVSSIARALLERASLEMQVRVHEAETRLNDFDFGDMWPKMTDSNPPAKVAFDKLRDFFLNYYKSIEGRWPPLTPAAEENWLNRTWAQRLQTDFSALYDYLVDRTVIWDGSEERSGRKWNIIRKGDRGFDTESLDLPFTDILVAFDNQNKFPHIPHPYCLVPEPMTPKKGSGDNLFKKSKQPEDKMASRKAALAYTNSTNVFLLGSDFIKNDMVEEFIKYEKDSYSVYVDPHAARRGRWVLIYGILQVLASVSVDSPNLHYEDGVSYHLSPKLQGTPPWVKNRPNPPEADPTRSHCWTVEKSWNPDPPVKFARDNTQSTTRGIPIQVQTNMPLMITSRGGSAAPSVSGSEGGSAQGGSFKKLPAFSPGFSSSSKSPKRRNTRDSSEKAETPTSTAYTNRSDQSGNLANSNAPRMPDRNDFIGNMAYSQHRHEEQPRRENVHNYSSRSNERTESTERREHSNNNNYAPRLQERHDNLSNTGYAPGIEKVEEWPIREESRKHNAHANLELSNDFTTKESSNFTIRDFDQYSFG